LTIILTLCELMSDGYKSRASVVREPEEYRHYML